MDRVLWFFWGNQPLNPLIKQFAITFCDSEALASLAYGTLRERASGDLDPNTKQALALGMGF